MIDRTKSIARSALACVLAAMLAACNISPVPFDTQSAKPSEQPQTSSQPQSSSQTQTSEQQKREDAQQSPSAEPTITGDANALGFEVMTDTDASAANGYVAMEPNYNTEEYGKVEETGFVSTQTSPLSTVSADVDTASYANLRRMLTQGFKTKASAETKKDQKTDSQKTSKPEYVIEDPDIEEVYSESQQVIPAGAVRIEEMVNYFDYAYEAPKDGKGFAINARVGACPWNKDTNLLVLGYATAPEDRAVREKGANLVFLIDVSGSMDDPDKLPLLQSAFGELVGQLNEKDRISIVTYSGEEEVVLEGESGANQQAIMKAIRGLKAHGSTNGEAGLRMAYDIAQKQFIQGGVNRIVMASDGDLNVGMTSESDLHDFVDKKRESGVYLSVLGFGADNYKDNKMETLADHGNGSYHYIDCEQEAKRVFGQRLTANLVPFANDVKVQVEFNPAKIKGYRLVGYENRTMAAEDFKNDAKDAGEVGPSSQFTVAYEIVPVDSAMNIDVADLKYEKPSPEASNAAEWLTAKLRYMPIDGKTAQEQELVVDDKSFSEDPGDDWRFVAAVTEFGMLLRDSEFKGSSTYDSVRKLVGKPKEELRTDFLRLVDLAEKN